MVDRMLEWGNVAYWYAMGGHAGSLLEAVLYLQQARLCGRVSLGVMAYTATSMLHEMTHKVLEDNHCDHGCCANAMALRWWARVSSLYGAPFNEAADFTDPATVLPSQITTRLVDTPCARVQATRTSGCGSSNYVVTYELANPCRAIGDDWDVATESYPGECSPYLSRRS